MASYDDLNVSRITTVGVISIVATAVTALAVQVMYYAMAERTDAIKLGESQYRRQNEFLAGQQTELSSFGVDPVTGSVTIPVEDAIKILSADGEQTTSNDTASDLDDA